MANYGMRSMISFAETIKSFGDLQTHLNRDMGRDLPEDLLVTGTVFGQGEVVDG